MVSEVSPAGVIASGYQHQQYSSIFLGDKPDNFVDVLPSFKLKWTQAHANKKVGVHIKVQKTPQVRFTLEGIQHQADYRFLDLDKIMIGSVALKRLWFTPNELTSDQASVIMDQ